MKPVCGARDTLCVRQRAGMCNGISPERVGKMKPQVSRWIKKHRKTLLLQLGIYAVAFLAARSVFYLDLLIILLRGDAFEIGKAICAHFVSFSVPTQKPQTFMWAPVVTCIQHMCIYTCVNILIQREGW